MASQTIRSYKLIVQNYGMAYGAMLSYVQVIYR